jgi:hypothetical protein
METTFGRNIETIKKYDYCIQQSPKSIHKMSHSVLMNTKSNHMIPPTAHSALLTRKNLTYLNMQHKQQSLAGYMSDNEYRKVPKMHSRTQQLQQQQQIRSLNQYKFKDYGFIDNSDTRSCISSHTTFKRPQAYNLSHLATPKLMRKHQQSLSIHEPNRVCTSTKRVTKESQINISDYLTWKNFNYNPNEFKPAVPIRSKSLRSTRTPIFVECQNVKPYEYKEEIYQDLYTNNKHFNDDTKSEIIPLHNALLNMNEALRKMSFNAQTKPLSVFQSANNTFEQTDISTNQSSPNSSIETNSSYSCSSSLKISSSIKTSSSSEYDDNNNNNNIKKEKRSLSSSFGRKIRQLLGSKKELSRSAKVSRENLSMTERKFR